MPAAEAANREHQRALVELHRLIRAGAGDSEEADAVRDRLEQSWRRLPAEERVRMEGLSGDLYLLSGDEVFEDVSSPERRRILLTEIEKATRQQEWGHVLALLRERPSEAPRDLVAEQRAIAYTMLDYLDAAAEFARFALEQGPATGQRRYLLLDLTAQIEGPEAALQLASGFEAGSPTDLWWLCRILPLLLRKDEASPPAEEIRSLGERLAHWLGRADEANLPPQLIEHALLCLGLCSLYASEPKAARRELGLAWGAGISAQILAQIEASAEAGIYAGNSSR